LNPPTDLRYTATHEWVRLQADGLATVGITDFAQDHLGELVYVELPEVGSALAQGEACAVVESTKAASDVYSPVAGLVVEVNAQLAAAPQTINESPFDAGWLFRIRLSEPSQTDALMDAAAYSTAAASQG
jgi:glycine cleavage system H protein